MKVKATISGSDLTEGIGFLSARRAEFRAEQLSGKKVRLIDSSLSPVRPDLVGVVEDFSPSTMEVQVKFSSSQSPRWYSAELLEVISDEV